MPIIDLQKRLAQVGRIRMGATAPTQNGGTRPVRLASWRLTSADRTRLDAAAVLYGGTVQPWDRKEGEYVLDTETDALPVAVLPGQDLTLWYELWGKPAQRKPIQCLRRCDGAVETISDGRCKCDPESRECKPTSRLNVLLTEVPGLGCWRFDSKGYYAAVELAGAVELLAGITTGGRPYPARLRIDQRKQVKDGDTVVFPVPVLDIDLTVGQALAALDDGPVRAAIEPGVQRALPAAVTAPESPTLGEMGVVPTAHTPIAPQPGTTVAEGLAAVAREAEPAAQRANAAAPLGPPVDEVAEAAVPIPVPDEADPIEPTPPPVPAPAPVVEPEQATAPRGDHTDPQAKKLNVLVGQLREAGKITTENLYAALARSRNLDAEVMVELVQGRDEGGKLHWAPLRESLSKSEAHDLIERLEKVSA